MALGTALLAALAACGGSSEPAGKDCLDCHASVGLAWANPSSHRFIYACTMCHQRRASEPGPGHRDKVDCTECHSEQAHPSTSTGGGPAFLLCDRCHDPHGSTNLALVRAEIATGTGGTSPVALTSLDGYAVGSYSDPRPGGEPGAGAGTGLCEICHTTTRTYRQDGTGAPHEGRRCTLCHAHARGFAPG